MYHGVYDCLKKGITVTGIRGLYKGYLLTLGSLMTHLAISFSIHDIVQKRVENIDFLVRLGSGTLASVISGILIYPLDTMRRRLQVSISRGFVFGYTSSLNCFVSMFIN